MMKLKEMLQPSFLRQVIFRRPKPIGKWTKAIRFFLFSVLAISLLAPLIANEKPLLVVLHDHYYFPAFTDLNPWHSTNFYQIKKTTTQESDYLQLDITNWKKLSPDFVIWCLVPYSPGKTDLHNANFSSPFEKQWFDSKTAMPFRFRHFLGTGALGQDLLAGIIHGTRNALAIGIFSMLLAAMFGLFLGAISGYFGNDRITLNALTFMGIIFGSMIGYFYSFYSLSFFLTDAFESSTFKGYSAILISCMFFLIIVAACYFIAKTLSEKFPKLPKWRVPVDFLVNSAIEFTMALPILIVIISLSALVKPGASHVIVIIALTSWTGIARLTRAEFMRIKQLNFMEAATALGFSRWRIILRHGLPNALSPALVVIIFGVANSILIEASLSFLGIGLGPENVSWGSLLNEGRNDFNAWWMTLFPGMAIFLTIFAFNYLGEELKPVQLKSNQ